MKDNIYNIIEKGGWAVILLAIAALLIVIFWI
jgi:hypothetical protein